MKMRKFLVIALSIMMLFAFTACDPNNDGPIENKVDLSDFQKDFFGLFSKLPAAGTSAKEYGAAELNTAARTSIDFYSVVGTYDSVESVELFGNEYDSEDDTFAVSIGNNNFFTDKVYVLEDGELSINNAMLLFSEMFGMEVKVNGTVIDVLEPVAASKDLEVADMKIAEGSTIEAAADSTNEFDVRLNDSKHLVSFAYDGKADGDVVLILNETKEGDGFVVKSTGYDLGSASDFGYYLVGYGSNVAGKDATTVRRDNVVIDSAGKVKGTYTLTFNLTFPEA